MSLKNRLRFAIVTLVTLMVFAQSVVSLRISAEGSFRHAVGRAKSAADQVRNLLLQRVNEQTARVDPPPESLDDRRRIWETILVEDAALPRLLESTVASSMPVVEILVCDEAGRILTGSRSPTSRLTYASLPDFADWNSRPLWDRLFEVMLRRKDYSTVIRLGTEGRTMFTIRVISSSVLLRNEILPQVRGLAILSVLSLLASMLLSVLFSKVLLRAVDRIGERIDRISTGKFAVGPATGARESREFAAVQSKLDILSQQFRGAKEDVVQLRGNIERLLDRLEEAVLLFDSEHRLIVASRPAERLLGRPLAELAGQPLEELLPPSTSVGAAVHRCLRSGEPVRDHLALPEHDGSGAVRLLVNVDLLRSVPGGHFGTLVTLQDPESRRQLRSQLDVSTRLTAISRLTGGIAHEIKNPLNAMALHLEILKSKLTGTSEVESEIDVIRREIARLDRVVKTFLDFTRPVDLKMREVDLVALLAEVARLVNPDAQRSQVQVQLDAGREKAYVRGDSDLLQQAFLNVVVNGIEAMPQGGRLRIGVATEAGEAVVTVADEGVGIAPHLREKIFNLYFTTKQKGSGIGLAMTFRVVQLHNATVDFTSELGKGTCFLLRFPAVEAAQHPAGPVPVTVPASVPGS